MSIRILRLIVIGIAVFTLGQLTAAQLDPTLENLALGKPVAASSVENSSHPPQHANDGSLATRWSSQFADNQWLIIDLEASYEVQQVVLNWETAYGESYDLDVSLDGFNWETVFEERQGDGGIDVINFGAPVSARFVRMTGLVRGTGWGFSLWEFEIFERDSVHRYVDSNGVDGTNDCLNSTDPCATITHAIGQSNPGNTIEIAAGTYTESFTIDKSLTLQGSGQGSTIIQAHAVPGVAGERVITIPAGLVVEIANATIRHGQVAGNGAAGEGGGIFSSGSTLILKNVTLNANAARSGGGLYNKNGSFSFLTGVTFSGNKVTAVGGGMRNFSGSSSTLTNVAFIGNEADRGGGMGNNTGSHKFTGVTFDRNKARLGGGLYNINISPEELAGVAFDGNEADENGGGMYNNGSDPALVNATFSENTAGNGGGMYNTNNSSPTLTNVEFIGNTATGGGGSFNIENSSPTFINVTFSGNAANVVGGGILNLVNSSPTVINTVIWGNTAAATNGGNEIFNEDDSAIDVLYSLYKNEPGDIVAGGGFSVDSNSLTDDPLFIDAASGDLRLQDGSPAIDAGNNTQCSAVDRRGAPRPVDGNGDGTAVCDIGAFEYGSSPYQLYLPLVAKEGIP